MNSKEWKALYIKRQQPVKQVLLKVIWEECITTLHGRECSHLNYWLVECIKYCTTIWNATPAITVTPPSRLYYVVAKAYSQLGRYHKTIKSPLAVLFHHKICSGDFWMGVFITWHWQRSIIVH